MERIRGFWIGIALLGFLSFVAVADEVEVLPGIITAMNVDVTADDGSLFPERFNVGDSIFIISDPKREKKGWVRVSRSQGDMEGFGWVESADSRAGVASRVICSPALPSS